MLYVLKRLFFLSTVLILSLTGQAQNQISLPAEAPEQTHRWGAVVDVYSYSQLMYDKVGVGGYFGAVTYKALPFATIGLGYDYSLYNHSALLDIRQEVSRMHLRPLLIAGLGYSLAGNEQTITSSFGLQQTATPKRGLVYRVGAGLRAYFSRKWPVAINASLFYKNEPGYQVTETKSGSLVINSGQNVGSLCLAIGLSF